MHSVHSTRGCSGLHRPHSSSRHTAPPCGTPRPHRHIKLHTAAASNNSPPTDLTELAGYTLQHGNGLARQMLSDPGLEGNPLDFLKQTEAFWKAMKNQKNGPQKPAPPVITCSSSTVANILHRSTNSSSTNSSSSSSSSHARPPSFGAAPAVTTGATSSSSSSGSSSVQGSNQHDFDVVMCGGTLGICVALALQQRGFRVAVVEKRRVEGRLQEWNSSRHELQVLVDLGLLTQSELEDAIKSEFNPIRVGFKGAAEPLAVNNVLNIGVCPKSLIAAMRARFEVLGGVIYEHTAFKSAVVGSDGVVVSLMNAAGAPADVGDTNRPNAVVQEQQPLHLHSPFGAVLGTGSSSSIGEQQDVHFAGSRQNNRASCHTSSGCSSGSDRGSGSGSSSSRYDRWLAAASRSSDEGQTLSSSSSSNSSRSSGSQPDSHLLGSTAAAADPTSIGVAPGSAANPTRHIGMQQQQISPQRPLVAAAEQHSRPISSSSKAPKQLTCRLLLDCMGHYSPIVKQMRGSNAKPDGMVLVVGGCATGFAPESNTSADLLYSLTDAAADMQLFWEAFPAEGGAARTTYMFCYSDADEQRPSFERLLDTYFTLLPAYQGLPGLEAVKFKRVLFGGFPCFSSAAPLAPGFDRVLQLGDASASQSPLSFGGFGSLLRHISRLSGAISHALQADALSQRELAWIHPYQPSLSATWLFQRSMSLRVGQQQQQHEALSAGPVTQQQQVPTADGAPQQQQSPQQQQQQQQSKQLLPDVGACFGGCVAVGAAGTGVAAVCGQEALAAAAAAVMVAAAAAGVAASVMGSLFSTQAQSPDGSNEPSINSSSSTSNGIDAHQQALNSSSSSSSTGAATAPNAAAAVSWWQRLALLPANHINALLGANFAVMAVLGQRVLKPFLQDTLQLGPLAATMGGMMLAKPLVISRVLVQVGPKVLLGWFGHFAMLAAYTLGHHLLKPFRHLSNSYTFQRLLDALQYGSGSDYSYAAAPPASFGTAGTAAGTAAAPSTAGTGGTGRRDSLRGPQQAGVPVGLGEVAAAVSGAGSRPAGQRVGGKEEWQRASQAVANNIVPGVPASLALSPVDAVKQQQQQAQQQPSAA